MAEDEDEENCDDRCRENAGVIVTEEICKTLSEGSGIDCTKLAQDVLDKKITPREYVDTIISHAENIGDKNNADILRKIKELMHG